MARRNLILVLILPVAAALLLAATAVYREFREPPLENLRKAMSSLEEARSAGAESWSADTYQKAQRHLRYAEQAISRINNSWWPFDSYGPADSLLSESIRLSSMAASQAGKKLKRHKTDVESEVARLDDSLMEWRDILDETLPHAEDEVLYRSASFKLQMAQQLLRRKQTDAARVYADSVKHQLDALRQRHLSRRSDHEALIERAQQWIKETIKESKNSKITAIIVDKGRHRLYLLSAGKVTDSIACDLGYNSGHQKRMAGDGATPEGRYHVTKVKRNSKYYRALLLNYPNAEDRKRFKSNIDAGVIPSDAKIGGLIEIHGNGYQGRDWTDGCVAVTDKDMDRLLRVAAVGTPVTIVRAWRGRQ